MTTAELAGLIAEADAALGGASVTLYVITVPPQGTKMIGHLTFGRHQLTRMFDDVSELRAIITKLIKERAYAGS